MVSALIILLMLINIPDNIDMENPGEEATIYGPLEQFMMVIFKRGINTAKEDGRKSKLIKMKRQMKKLKLQYTMKVNIKMM